VANITLMVRPSSIHAAIEPQRKDPLRSDGGHKLDSNQANKKDGVWPVLPEAGDDDPDDIIAGNSLDGGSTGRHGKFFDLKQGKSRPLDSWTREESQDVVGNEDDSLFNGPLYSDQEQLLWPFQNHQHHQSQDEQQQKEEDKAPKKERAQKTQGRSRSRANRRRKVKNSRRTVKTNQNDRAASPFGGPNAGTTAILGKGKAEHLVFEWLVTPWSKCSQTCGGSGFQVRAAQCMVRLNNVTKSVEGGLCEDAGLDVPSAMQKCGLDICPRWEVGAWTPCQQSRCFTWNTAIQRRRLQCLMQNGTALDTVLCSEQTRPAEKRECFNENCRGTWKVSDWSEVS